MLSLTLFALIFTSACLFFGQSTEDELLSIKGEPIAVDTRELSIRQLKALASLEQLKGYSKMNKAELLRNLKW